jgi:hypothetical protein
MVILAILVEFLVKMELAATDSTIFRASAGMHLNASHSFDLEIAAVLMKSLVQESFHVALAK